jgi:hypothetical protein
MRTNRIIAIAAMALLGTTVFIACKKEQKEEPVNNSIPTSSLKSTTAQEACDPVINSSPFFSSNKNIDEQVEIAAQLHNDYLEYFFQSAVRDNIKYSSSNYDTYFRDISKKFFESKGIILQENSYYACMKTIDPEENIDYLAANLSVQGKEIFQNVLTTINSFDQVSQSDFTNKMNSLYNTCNSLQDQESISLKLMIKVGLRSIEYWGNNIQKWEDYFRNDDKIMVARGTPKHAATNKEILMAAGKADLSGAYKGAVGGGLGGGPAGAVAGALVVGGTFSAARIIAGAIFNWW